MKKQSTMIACALAVVSGVLLCLGGCNQSPEVVIYSNADEESRLAMQDALDRAGFSGQYIFSSFSTSELGGKIMAEGSNIEADVITASTYYLESAPFVGMNSFMSILSPIAIIGFTSFVLSMAGNLIGVFCGKRFNLRTELWGGLILIAIGIKILIEHLYLN